VKARISNTFQPAVKAGTELLKPFGMLMEGHVIKSWLENLN